MKTKYTIPNYILASKNTRMLHFVVDVFFINIVFSIAYLLASFVKFNADFPLVSDWIDSFDPYKKIIYRTIICFFYYGFTEYFLARTLAKYFTKTIVVLKDGSKPNFIAILTRTTLRIMPFECLTFLKGRRLGLHDEYSGTFVVKKEKLEVSKKEFSELQ
ncbi:RDD family protein [Flavobacterium restrictum]|uniref:RDD family protein n=1 Tax=Flavobacterium restrictum TaxID=2594428 RepID=A0A553EBJ5_9FLAO|nr:RDD family protein [Flavobacterium restrictum]TRX42325.1 RDD family protein [Flavobacterium restrictum]